MRPRPPSDLHPADRRRPARLGAASPLTVALAALALSLLATLPSVLPSSTGELHPASDAAAAIPDGPRDARPRAPGTISGHLEIERPRPRRTPNRYPARGAPPARRIQELPAVVYLRGGSGSAPPPEPAMEQRDTAFAPGILVVPVGAEVAFPNRDPFFHNVFSYSSPARFDLGRYPTGQSKSVTFDEPGVVKVYCEVHEFMRGAVVVTETGRHAVVDDDGGFRLEDVPAGEWTVVAWHADLGSTEATVTVTEGATAEIQMALGGGDAR